MKKIIFFYILIVSLLSSCHSPVVPSNEVKNTIPEGPIEHKFEFYSSCEDEIDLAYKTSLAQDWQFQEMDREGNYFTATLPINHEIWYEFVNPENIWYNRDPYNKYINDDHPYLNKELIYYQSYKNKNVKYVSSEHFDLFINGSEDLINDMEKRYDYIVNLLSFFDEEISPIYNKKIRYHSRIKGLDGMYAMSARAMIVDSFSTDVNSHEIIHVLLYKYPHYAPLAEGIAQAFQEQGNRRPLLEDNCTLASYYKVKSLSLKDCFADFNSYNDYHLPGSFIYYNIKINIEHSQSFINLLKYFTVDHWNISLSQFESLFLDYMGYKLDSAIEDWKQWLNTIDNNSDIYIDWNSLD